MFFLKRYVFIYLNCKHACVLAREKQKRKRKDHPLWGVVTTISSPFLGLGRILGMYTQALSVFFKPWAGFELRLAVWDLPLPPNLITRLQAWPTSSFFKKSFCLWVFLKQICLEKFGYFYFFFMGPMPLLRTFPGSGIMILNFPDHYR